jgi:hypothetical protein
VIQDVEQFRAELQLQRFMKRKISMNGKVPLPSSKSAQRVPPQISLPEGQASRRVNGGIGKRRGIKSFPTWILWSIQVQWFSGNNIWPC